MIGIDEARLRLLAAATVREAETVDLRHALGRVLAAEIRVDRDQPPTDRSAMDGYAVRAADAARAGTVLELVGEVRAGQPAEVRVDAGQAVRILTGAVIPEGADTVVMVEHTAEVDGGRAVRLERAAEPDRHIRRRAEDRRAGDPLLAPGTLLQPPEIAALATVGAVRVQVHRAPRVAVLSTGDEIVEPGARPEPHQVRNSNAETLVALARQLGFPADNHGIATDEEGELARAIEHGLGADLLLLTGGVSVGRYDLVRPTLERLGIDILFHKVAMRPGKPVLAGSHAGGLVVGLPGNPVSAFTGFLVLVAPCLRRMDGSQVDDLTRVTATLAEPLRVKRGRTTFHLGRVEAREAGWQARATPTASSGDVLSIVRANAFLETPPDGDDLPAGAPVQALVWPAAHQRVHHGAGGRDDR